MLEKRIKQYLDDIIDEAYKDVPEDQRKRYHWFKLYIRTKENSSSSGMYHVTSHIIEIYNPSLGEKHLAKTCLHEVSHHIDWCQNGFTGHKKPFYDAYRRLIYASLNLSILKTADFYDEWSSDHAKVLKIVEAYVPHKVDYQKPTQTVVRVKNCYVQKEFIKENGYYWNSVEQVWEKTTEDTKKEEQFLTSIGIRPASEQSMSAPQYTIEQTDIYINAIVYIKAEGKTYDEREFLKKSGFHFREKERIWAKKTTADELEKELKTLAKEAEGRPLRFRLWNRK